jgi:thermolysin
LRKESNIDSQSAVGSGRGVLGDTKEDQYECAAAERTAVETDCGRRRFFTIDGRASVASMQRFVAGGRWSDSDLAVDSDNVWTDAAVVDAHAQMGWVYDYYFKTHRHQGLDGRNSPIIGVLATRAAIQGNAYFAPPPIGPDGNGGMFFGESFVRYADDRAGHHRTRTHPRRCLFFRLPSGLEET